ncbi:hypothetical protein F5X99DRAFT_275730 [Biscogniauxia marginata]|nr:hypothetical protein F5X99DRAFT_275730 [Biscogniauxia marginata]
MFSRHSNRQRESSRSHRSTSKHSHRHGGSGGRSEIDIVDLDALVSGRQPYKVSTKHSSRLTSITSHLRRTFPDEDQKIPEDAVIQYFFADKRLDGDEIPSGLSTLRYRVLGTGDDGSFRFHWGGNRRGSRWNISSAQLNQLIPLVEAGCTIGELREAIAQLLGTSDTSPNHVFKDANRIVIQTGGLRPGPVQGNSWVARKVDVWLSRYFWVGVASPENYFVFRGFNEEYIWHNPSVDRNAEIEARALKRWLKHSVLAAVHPGGSYRRGIDVDDIRLFRHGKRVKDHDRLHPGACFEFELPRSVEDDYIQAESWLLSTTVRCTVCDDDKMVSEMPRRRRITKDCKHEATVCKECVEQWITSSLEPITWDRLKCPECPQLLKFGDVRAFASKDTFERYDLLATKAALNKMGQFQWCLNPRCDAGQINPAGCSKAKCYACESYSCAHHHVPWHHKESCAEYSHRTRKLRRGEKLSEQRVKEITKPCPGCNRNVNKYTGCDHITCICGHEWCWLCFATYRRDENHFLTCDHKAGCQYHGDPPNYEGGRAFMHALHGEGLMNPFAPRPMPEQHGDRRQPLEPHGHRERSPVHRGPRLVIPPLNANPQRPDQPWGRVRGRGRGRRTDFMDQAFHFNLANLIQRTL